MSYVTGAGCRGLSQADDITAEETCGSVFFLLPYGSSAGVSMNGSAGKLNAD